MLSQRKSVKRGGCPNACIVLFTLSVAVIVVSCVAFLLVDVDTPPLANVFLSQKYFPHGQQLKLKSRRLTPAHSKLTATSCDGFGVARDFYFAKMGGVQCAQLVWRSAVEFEEGDRFVAQLDTVYKVFQNKSLADEYFVKFWGRHLYDPLPSYLYVNETDAAPAIGDVHRAFRWDVNNVLPGMPVPLQAASTPRHIVYIFRKGRFFVRIAMQAFANARDGRLGVDTAGRLAGVVSELIRANELPEWREWFRRVQLSCRASLSNVASKVVKWSTKTTRKAFAFVKKWIEAKATSLLAMLTKEGASVLVDFGWTFLVIQDFRLLVIALIVLLHNRFNAFLKPYGEIMNSQTIWCGRKGGQVKW
eukprot:m.33610 g.33610  ORF g.33610 m.33610 type:complete len:361 (+) comp31852_c0_seq2:237-1319(+)